MAGFNILERRFLKLKGTDWDKKTMTFTVKKNIWFWIWAIARWIRCTQIKITFLGKWSINAW